MGNLDTKIIHTLDFFLEHSQNLDYEFIEGLITKKTVKEWTP